MGFALAIFLVGVFGRFRPIPAKDGSTGEDAPVIGKSVPAPTTVNLDEDPVFHVIPVTAKSPDEVVAAVEKVKGFGYVSTAEFNCNFRKIFAAWYCPFSGRGDCFVHAYYFDFDKNQWVRFLHRLAPAGGLLSVELPLGEEVIVFRDGEGKISVKESIAKLPHKLP